jgi:hypothetical protein
MHPLTILESILRQVCNVTLFGDNILVDTMKKNTESLIDVTKEVVLHVNAWELSICCCLTRMHGKFLT